VVVAADDLEGRGVAGDVIIEYDCDDFVVVCDSVVRSVDAVGAIVLMLLFRPSKFILTALIKG
jgi:hypothetical protein